MVRRRSASPKPSAPVRSVPTTSPTMTRAAPPMPPRATPTGAHAGGPAMGAPSQGPGLMAQMAATAGGVAIGSAVGHTVGHMMTGGGRTHDEVIANQASSAAPAAQQYANPCEFEWKQFIECTQNQADVSLCQGFNEAFKQCRSRNP